VSFVGSISIGFAIFAIVVAVFALNYNAPRKREEREREQQYQNLMQHGTGKTWDMRKHRSWGNRIEWHDFERRTVVGWIDRTAMFGSSTPSHGVCVGDDLICPMQSGKIGRFRFTEVKYERDPPDMFIGKVIGIAMEDAK